MFGYNKGKKQFLTSDILCNNNIIIACIYIYIYIYKYIYIYIYIYIFFFFKYVDFTLSISFDSTY